MVSDSVKWEKRAPSLESCQSHRIEERCDDKTFDWRFRDCCADDIVNTVLSMNYRPEMIWLQTDKRFIDL